jgi:sulfur carrier protein ThiS
MRLRQGVPGRRPTEGPGAVEATKWVAYFAVSVKVHVAFRPRRRPDVDLELAPGATARDALRAVGEPESGTVVVRSGSPVPETAPLADGDRLLLLSSFSGG